MQVDYLRTVKAWADRRGCVYATRGKGCWGDGDIPWIPGRLSANAGSLAEACEMIVAVRALGVAAGYGVLGFLS